MAKKQSTTEQTENGPLHRGFYLLPNLFTTAGLFAGFYAIVAAMKGLFAVAPVAIFVGMVMDGMDGRVARLTNTETAFGSQYDSLSDMVAFGVAPALVAYHWSLLSLGKMGWLIAFFYTATTALRLARFNTKADIIDKSFFQGLPCPAAAAVIAGLVWIVNSYDITGKNVSLLVGLITAFVAFLMISDIRYYSFKTLDFKGRVPFIAFLGVLLAFVGLTIFPAHILFITFFGYALSGPLWLIWSKLFRRKKKLIVKQ